MTSKPQSCTTTLLDAEQSRLVTQTVNEIAFDDLLYGGDLDGLPPCLRQQITDLLALAFASFKSEFEWGFDFSKPEDPYDDFSSRLSYDWGDASKSDFWQGDHPIKITVSPDDLRKAADRYIELNVSLRAEKPAMTAECKREFLGILTEWKIAAEREIARAEAIPVDE